MSNQNNGGVEFFAGLVVGGLVGAALAMVLAPQSGEETRAQIRDKSLQLKDRAEDGVSEARHRTMSSLEEQFAVLQKQVETLTEKGKEAVEKSKQTATEAINKGKDVISKATNRG